MPYLAYMRPRTFLVTFVFVLTGYVLAPGPVTASRALSDLAFLFLVYSVLGWGGGNAFNSAEDRDTGPVNLLPNPPPRPAHLGAFGLGCGALAVIVASAWPGMTRVVPFVLACQLLSIAYSWRSGPFRRLKEVGVLDAVTHALGTGPLALAIGWGARAPFESRAWVYALGFFLALFGGYATTQIFQLSPRDTYATARNYTSLVGPARALRIGALAFAAHVLVLASVARGHSVARVAFAAWALLVVAAAAHSLCWSRRPFAHAHRGMLRQMALMMASQVCFLVGACAR